MLNVGHGLCVLVGWRNEVFVYDCGDAGGRKGIPYSWKRLVQRTVEGERISTIAVSHFHRDHYVGLFEPLPNARPDLELIIGAMPELVGNNELREEFLLAILSYSLFNPSLGLPDLELQLCVKRSAPELTINYVVQNDTFYASGERWTVLWPPPRLRLGTKGHKQFKDAVEAYNRAEKDNPQLAECRRTIQEGDNLESIMRRANEASGEEWALLDDELMEVVQNDEGDSNSVRDMDEDSLTRAGKLLGCAANSMSLVVISDSRILLTGDASPAAMKEALGENQRNCSVVQTPHHGGRRHVPKAFCEGTLRSDLWVSSVGANLINQIYSGYSDGDETHLNTLSHGDIDALVSGHLVKFSFEGNRSHGWQYEELMNETFFLRYGGNPFLRGW